MTEIEKIAFQRDLLLKVLNVVMATPSDSTANIVQGLVGLLIYSEFNSDLLIGDDQETHLLELIRNWFAAENAIRQAEEILK